MRLHRTVFTTCIALVLWLVSSLALAGVPTMVPVQGHLRDANGTAVDGAHDLSFALFEASTGGVALYTERREGLVVTQGDFIVYLGELLSNAPDGGSAGTGDGGSVTTLTPGFFRDHNELWLEVVIDGTDIIKPRFRMGTVPFASFAQYCAEPAGALSATLEGMQGKEASLEQRVATLEQKNTTLQAQVTTLQGQMTTVQGQITSILARIAGVEGKAVLTAVNGFNITSGDFYPHCIAGPGNAQYCNIMANRNCVARGYAGGWYVGETDGVILSIVCVK